MSTQYKPKELPRKCTAPGRKYHRCKETRTRLHNDPDGDWLVEVTCRDCGETGHYKCIYAI